VDTEKVNTEKEKYKQKKKTTLKAATAYESQGIAA
jgi:hypothetical protein